MRFIIEHFAADREHPSMVDTDKYIILTGATGLLGQYLMKDLLERGYNLTVIARSSKKLSASRRSALKR